MITIGEASKMVKQYMVDVTEDEAFYNNEVFDIVSKVQVTHRMPSKKKLREMKEKMTDRGYDYAMKLMQAHVSGDRMSQFMAFSGKV